MPNTHATTTNYRSPSTSSRNWICKNPISRPSPISSSTGTATDDRQSNSPKEKKRQATAAAQSHADLRARAVGCAFQRAVSEQALITKGHGPTLDWSQRLVRPFSRRGFGRSQPPEPRACSSRMQPREGVGQRGGCCVCARSGSQEFVGSGGSQSYEARKASASPQARRLLQACTVSHLCEMLS